MLTVLVMVLSSAISFLKVLNPARLSGPIFDKELRVSSRQRRNYVLRFVYILALTVFIFLVWSSVVSIRSNLAAGIALMSEAGKIMVATIVWFQFISLQLIVVVMLSTSISDEIYHKTLGLLMTTPITGFQIVAGKLLSKLIQSFLLLAISFPLLAILRIFGGVPWDYVISSFCITFTAVLFAGALSLYFSIGSRYAYVVILRTVFVLGIIYFFIPSIIGMVILYAYYRNFFISTPVSLTSFLETAVFCNPFLIMSLNTSRAFVQTIPFGAIYWPLHCLVMFFLTSLVIARSVKVVRKAALRQATGQLDYSKPMKNPKPDSLKEKKGLFAPLRAIREVKGEPLVWKEMMSPLIEGGKRKAIIAAAAAVFALLLAYYSNYRSRVLSENISHVGYSLVFVLLGLITNVALSATSITTEKESQSWPILMATPLTDWQIIIGKAVGALRRCFPVWIFLAGHLIIFTLIGWIHPAAIIHLGMIVAGVLIFLNGSGLYLGSRFRRTISAVVANFAIVLIVWFVVPLISEFIIVMSGHHNLSGITMSANPVVQTIVSMNADSGVRAARGSMFLMEYEWPFGLCKTFFSTTALLLGFLLFYSGLGLLFAWRAKCNIRRNIF